MATTSLIPSQMYLGRHTPEQEQAQLTAAAEPIIACGVPACFDRLAALKAFYTFKNFIKLVKFVASFKSSSNTRVLNDVISIGVKQNFFTHPKSCTLQDFVQLAHYLKSPQGLNDVRLAQRSAKAAKKAAETDITVEEVVLRQVFSAQRQEYVAEVKRMQRELEAKTNAREMQAALVAAKERFAPASFFEDYAKEKSMRGKQRENAELEFAARPEFREGLIGYLKERLLRFRAEFDKRGEMRVADQLVMLGGSQALEEDIAAEAERGYKRRRI